MIYSAALPQPPTNARRLTLLLNQVLKPVHVTGKITRHYLPVHLHAVSLWRVVLNLLFFLSCYTVYKISRKVVIRPRMRNSPAAAGSLIEACIILPVPWNPIPTNIFLRGWCGYPRRIRQPRRAKARKLVSTVLLQTCSLFGGAHSSLLRASQTAASVSGRKHPGPR